MSEPMDIISLGAGVQSSTMALMAAAGEITPMPKAAIFADTQDEPAYARELARYRVLRREFLAEHRTCEARMIARRIGHYRCELWAKDVHHTRGRGKHLCNVDSFIAVCRSCHDFIGDHKGLARSVGLILPP